MPLKTKTPNQTKQFSTIIPMNYLTKGRKYLMFVDIRKVGCFEGKVWFLNANFILSSGLSFNKM